MTTATMSTFFALLSLACWAATIALVVLALASRFGGQERAGELLDAIGEQALWLAWLIAAVAMAGSLYYSEVAHFVPCELCWYQRICMYPLAVVLLVAALRRDRGIWRYAIGPLAIGAVIGTYHTQLQAFPTQHSFCAATIPCNIRFVWKFGFVSLPFMALAGFCCIASLVLVAARLDRAEP